VPLSSSDRRSRLAELRTGMSLLTSAAADLGVGDQPEVRVLPDGRLWLTELGTAVTAAEVYQAARRLVAAQLDAVAQVSDQPVEDHALAWLVTLQTDEVMAGIEDDAPGDDAPGDDALGDDASRDDAA
jgi:hypothetical protein